MGLAGALGLFASILFHELSHSLVARQYDLKIKGITLFIFGGVAEMEGEPATPKIEFFVAVIGPISSYFLAAVFHGLTLLSGQQGWPPTIEGVVSYLCLVNILLATFNLVPAFPLDGGRILRSWLWKVHGNLRTATRIASRSGSFFGMVLIVFGFFNLINGNFIGGMWYCLIGLFLRQSANMAYQDLIVKHVLKDQTVKDLMNTNPVTVSGSLLVSQLVEDYFYKFRYDLFPVIDASRLLGSVTIKEVKSIPAQDWNSRQVITILRSLSESHTVSPHTNVLTAMSRMTRGEIHTLLVVENEELLGVLSLKDILRFLSIKVELEQSSNR